MQQKVTETSWWIVQTTELLALFCILAIPHALWGMLQKQNVQSTHWQSISPRNDVWFLILFHVHANVFIHAWHRHTELRRRPEVRDALYNFQ